MTSETFTFSSIPTTASEIAALPEATLDTPFKTVALAMLALLNYEKDPEGTYAMLDFLRGPEPLNNFGKAFLKERLNGKFYKPFSFFAGATVANGYKPTEPLTITVRDNPYSYPEENYALLLVKSSGADSERQVRLRKKPSTGQWFITGDLACLSDIRIPADQDPWA